MDNAQRQAKSPAFPATERDHTIGTIGLTKREYFALMALQGILARADAGTNAAVKNAVAYADALLLELSK